ncbi:hypothetical protein [uncultured Umboniibacter sp.]|uniref:hypothetical protein n=1 Tax=uncultured Umboniibacter sp. TaxID=1798917 RepID=UPI00261D395F|nr:hypothetical protein [uncultured Umboniibacter sp.]
MKIIFAVLSVMVTLPSLAEENSHDEAPVPVVENAIETITEIAQGNESDVRVSGNEVLSDNELTTVISVTTTARVNATSYEEILTIISADQTNDDVQPNTSE